MDEAAPLWQRCERAWAEWLGANEYAVFNAAGAVGNAPGTSAPMIRADGRLLRAPDIHTTKQQVTEYWEVKSRSRSDVDELTGEREHWMELAVFRDYVAVARVTGARVWVVLFEAPTAIAEGRWLRIEVRDLRDSGRRGRKLGRDGTDVEAWIWPVGAMTVIHGPAVGDTADAPLLPEDGGATPIPDAEYDLVARRGRRRRAVVEPDPAVPVSIAESVIDQDPVVGLDFLRRRLGVPALPAYSVLALAPDPARIEDLLALLDYGIRVFVVSEEPLEWSMDPQSLRAFVASRLLEWAQVGESVGPPLWVVDGQIPPAAQARVSRALDLADASGGMNARQYRVVHADPDSDVMIVAGAGTGKTETMAERIVFLLATYALGSTPEGTPPRHMRADQIALVTFTRDAASEMRGRIARTLMLRQRLSSRCALPVLAWLMQLSGADISTIHSFAKRTVSRSGGALGVSPGFRVSRLTMTWRALVDRALSPVLEDLYRRFGDEVPAAYEWERHLQEVWESLANNGVDLLDFAGTGSGPVVAWGDSPGGELSREVVSATQLVLTQVAERFRVECLAQQATPMDQLVSLAISGLNASRSSPKHIRYLFVDEFQDTDARQMELLLTVRERLGARLFVVGDPKQGVYRFRGAAGDAFTQFRDLWTARGLEPFQPPFLLTRNFRSGQALLNSLHPYFTAWGGRRLLEYSAQDRLLPRAAVVDRSEPAALTPVRWGHESDLAASQALAWRADDEGATIGILCRQNWQALQVQRAIRELGGSCEIRIGGDFFRSPAVRELRVLLEAVASPSDDAALLELVETRWAAGILTGEAPVGLTGQWGEGPIETMAWSARLAALNDGESIVRADLEGLRQRVIALAGQLDSMPTLAWVVECNRAFGPATCSRPEADDDVERARYLRCFDQLVTRMDAQFANAPASLESVLFWLRLQVATNFTEDEDAEAEATPGRTIALTVHKAKGAEFDYVLVPWTTTPFRRRKYVNRATVLREDGMPRLAWEWKPFRGEFTNVATADAGLWQRDDSETAQEETRLLYVAMTRAKRRLTVFVPERLPQTTDNWAGLLAAGGA
ncbi:hypothetical protein N798_03795 [Knoellia flava TL1]|uniref:DNA 3'-5' helicase n=2 Tax=Knoellia flava TaxID=913969 RepID=A0A8H9FVD6_9MICO|nr:ATP-dependent helicase [Knoellia flava]KGN35255.1 hypothetical protein N798_03795 [Knoellia flava TL1]GGB90056.1 hypothetical protein GCM10011314_32400 [Knoellia flava]